MKIAEILRRRSGPSFSVEFFPPKTLKGEAALYRTVDDLRRYAPSYVSVTWGAGGATRGKTVEWAERIKKEHGVESMAHLTCVGATRAELEEILRELDDHGIRSLRDETIAFQVKPGEIRQRRGDGIRVVRQDEIRGRGIHRGDRSSGIPGCDRTKERLERRLRRVVDGR
mgnify:CR=1 FL=1